MSKIGTAQIEIKPVLNREALDEIVQQIEGAVAAAQPAIRIGRYEEGHEYTGWIEDRESSWIVYLGPDGKPSLYWRDREDSGAVVGDPVDLK